MAPSHIAIDTVCPMLKTKDLQETIRFYTSHLGFEVVSSHPREKPKNVRALWAQLRDVVAVEWELQEMDYGMLEFAIRDCNGYTLSFGQDVNLAL